MEKIKPLRIIFITLVAIDDIQDRNIYADLMRYFVSQGHHVTIISPAERRNNIPTNLKQSEHVNILRIKTPNIQKINVIEKTIGTFALDFLIKGAIKKYLRQFQFDLAIYSTPPITLVNTIDFLKKKYALSTYLLLKDIFPQNAVDLGFMKKGALIYNYFRKKESLLYKLSDHVGCMSQANVDYVLKHNPEVPKSKVELCPNSVEISNASLVKNDSSGIREKLGIAKEQLVFIYGGNLGKPQGIDFLIEVLNTQLDNAKAFFIIIGSGTEFSKLEKWYQQHKSRNVYVQSYIPKEEYDKIVNISDVGLIFLDHKFQIPNYPSRLLAYLENKLPVLAMTDSNTDIGSNAEKRGYGKWCPSNDLEAAKKVINYFCKISNEERQAMGQTGYDFLENNYTVAHTYNTIINHQHVS